MEIYVGGEVEFLPLYVDDCRFSRLQRYNIHQDYGVAWEVNTPVVRVKPGDDNVVREAVRTLAEVERLVWEEGGVRVHFASYGVDCGENALCGVFSDPRRPMSAHLHFSAESDADMVFIHNALVVLQPYIVPLITLPVDVSCSDDADCYFSCNITKHGFRFRRRVRRFAAVPAYATLASLNVIKSAPIQCRGYWPRHGNSYFAVEFNKYRKSVVTVEARMNENHVVVGIVLSEIIAALREKGWRPPLLPLRDIYSAVYDGGWPPLPLFDECSDGNYVCHLEVILDKTRGRVSGFTEAVLDTIISATKGKEKGGATYIRIWEIVSEYTKTDYSRVIEDARKFYSR